VNRTLPITEEQLLDLLSALLHLLLYTLPPPMTAQDVLHSASKRSHSTMTQQATNASAPGSDTNTAADRPKQVPKRWSKAEDELLRTAIAANGPRAWKQIAAKVPGRSHAQCLQRWSKVLRPGLIKGPWTTAEDEVLTHHVVELGWSSWTDISRAVKGRTSKQCRERWFHHLDPTIKRDAYTLEEDALILRHFHQAGDVGRWAAIAAMLPGRTDDAVKIRCNTLLRLERSGKLDVRTMAGGGPARHRYRKHRRVATTPRTNPGPSACDAARLTPHAHSHSHSHSHGKRRRVDTSPRTGSSSHLEASLPSGFLSSSSTSCSPAPCSSSSAASSSCSAAASSSSSSAATSSAHPDQLSLRLPSYRAVRRKMVTRLGRELTGAEERRTAEMLARVSVQLQLQRHQLQQHPHPHPHQDQEDGVRDFTCELDGSCPPSSVTTTPSTTSTVSTSITTAAAAAAGGRVSGSDSHTGGGHSEHSRNSHGRKMKRNSSAGLDTQDSFFGPFGFGFGGPGGAGRCPGLGDEELDLDIDLDILDADCEGLDLDALLHSGGPGGCSGPSESSDTTGADASADPDADAGSNKPSKQPPPAQQQHAEDADSFESFLQGLATSDDVAAAWTEMDEQLSSLDASLDGLGELAELAGLVGPAEPAGIGLGILDAFDSVGATEQAEQGCAQKRIAALVKEEPKPGAEVKSKAPVLPEKVTAEATTITMPPALVV